MTIEQYRWSKRAGELLEPLYHRFVKRPGQPLRMSWRLRAYCLAMRAHRWLWVRGIEL